MKRSEFMLGGVDFKGLCASQIMETEVHLARSDHTWKQAAGQMTRGRFGDVPIVDDKGMLVGIVTEHDLLKALREESDVEAITAGEIMTPAPIWISPETPFGEILDLLVKCRLVRVPVVKDGRVVGIVARRDIVSAYLQATQRPPGTL